MCVGVFSPRRGSGPYRGVGAAVPQPFDRNHPSLPSGGDSQPPPRLSRRMDPVVAEPQRVTMAAAPTLTQQSIAVVPAAVLPPPQAPPPVAQVAVAEQTNPPPARCVIITVILQ